MAEIKTKVNNSSVKEYILSSKDESKIKDGKLLLSVFKKATGMTPKMWGTRIVGYGMYHYKSGKSSQEGDWPLTGFAIGKQKISIYIMPGFSDFGDLLEKLGKHKFSGGSCLYVNNMKDVDTEVLVNIIKKSVVMMKKKYKV